jgi:hypothetical protein
MATAAPTVPDRTMSADRVFGRAFGTIFHNPLVTLGLAFIFGAVPTALSSYAMNIVRSNAMQAVLGGAGPSTQDYIYTFYGLTIISWALNLIIIALTQAVLTRATVAESENRRASFAESLSAGLRVLLPLIALMILLAVAVMVGLMLLIVPGVILYVICSVATPALVEERVGVFGAFGRSRQLTKGARWKILGILLVMLIVYWFVSLIAGFLMINFLGTGGAAMMMQQGLPLGFIIVTLVVGTVVNVLWGTIQASLYVELKEWKEGGSVENLEQVFA